jgi:hypothetical protein
MFLSQRRSFALVALVAFLAVATASRLPARVAAQEDKPLFTLPKDPKAVVISYDPGAGGFIRKGEAPYLKIQADGQVTVTNLHDGSKKEGKLTVKELEELLTFIVKGNDFFALDKAKIDDGIKEAAGKGPFLAVGGAGTSVIGVNVNEKKHEVSFRAAKAFQSAYPKVKMLGQFVAIEKRLSDLGASTAKGK